MNAERAVFVYTTCPSLVEAERIGKALLERRLAACVNILPGMVSVYSWQGAMESSPESLLLIKTERQAYPRLEARLRELHPYVLPEIIALDIERGLPDYLKWISQCLTPASHP